MKLEKRTMRQLDGTRSAKVIQVIETQVVIGKGTEADPLRYLVQYWSLKGELLAERDTLEDGLP